MATRSFISRKIPGGYEGIYCHFSGDIAGVGVELFHDYTSVREVARLLSFGDMSSLPDLFYYEEAECDPTGKPTLARQFKTQHALLTAAYDAFCDYIYLFDSKERWKYLELEDPTKSKLRWKLVYDALD